MMFRQKKEIFIKSGIFIDHRTMNHNQMKIIFKMAYFFNTRAYARWAHMRCFLSVCNWTKIQTRQKVTGEKFKFLRV